MRDGLLQQVTVDVDDVGVKPDGEFSIGEGSQHVRVAVPHQTLHHGRYNQTHTLR